MHAFWELASAALPSPGARPVLRFHESGRRFDVEIDLAAHNWYVDLWSPNKTYYAELGWRTRSGAFTPLARSNEVRTPPAHVAQARSSPAAAITPTQAIQAPPVRDLPIPPLQNHRAPQIQSGQIPAIENPQITTFQNPQIQNPPIPTIQNSQIPTSSQTPTGVDALVPTRPPGRGAAPEDQPLQTTTAEPNQTTEEPSPPDLTQYAEERFAAGLSSAQDPRSA